MNLFSWLNPSKDESTESDRAIDPGYPHGALLVEPTDLASAGETDFVVLDTRPREKYDSRHIPHARWVDHDTWSKGFGEGGDAASWSQRIGLLGLDGRTPVVVYDEDYKRSARVWWLLRYWGVSDVRLLNGGWTAWKAEGLSKETQTHEPTPAAFTAQPNRKLLATKDQVLASLANGSLQIVDARGPKEYHGEDKGKNKHGGAIPGAKHLEWSELIDEKTQRFKSAAQLRERLIQSHIALDYPTVTHCQSGARASVMMFALELLGAESVCNYYASWAEWGNADDTPIAAGPAPQQREPGEVPPG
ncbi:MAG TPA: sulfurtransferase [Pirellulales bacterium]